MKNSKFKFFVYPTEALKKNDIHSIGGFIFDSNMYSIEEVKNSIKQFDFDWELVDYHKRNKKLLSSEDTEYDIEKIINYNNSTSEMDFFFSNK